MGVLILLSGCAFGIIMDSVGVKEPWLYFFIGMWSGMWAVVIGAAQ